MEVGKIYKNNVMVLRLVAIIGKNAVFAHLMNGETVEYIAGILCDFNGDEVTWGWGHYNLTDKYISNKE